MLLFVEREREREGDDLVSCWKREEDVVDW